MSPKHVTFRPYRTGPRQASRASRPSDAVRVLGHTGTMTDDVSSLLATFTDAVPFARHIGVRLTAASPDEVVAVLDWAPEVDNGAGVMHGGALMSLADSAASICAFLNLPNGTFTTTTDAHSRFLRPVSASRAIATARPVRVGRTSIIVATEIHDEAGKLVVTSSQSQAVIPLPPTPGRSGSH